jgi:hypothetical protein
MATDTLPAGKGFQTRTREVNFVLTPAPATRHEQEIVPAPVTRGHIKPAGHPCPPAARQQAVVPWDCKHIEPPPPARAN